MLLIAATTGLQKIQSVPPMFWLKALGVIAAFVAAVIILRKVAQMNKIVLSVIVFVVIVGLGFNWIYERNEPAFLTPLVNRIAPFLPAKGSYGATQQGGPKM